MIEAICEQDDAARLAGRYGTGCRAIVNGRPAIVFARTSEPIQPTDPHDKGYCVTAQLREEIPSQEDVKWFGTLEADQDGQALINGFTWPKWA